jgi:hypothetical protein
MFLTAAVRASLQAGDFGRRGVIFHWVP